MGQRCNIYEIATYSRQYVSGKIVEVSLPPVRVSALSRGHLRNVCIARNIPVRNSKTDVKYVGPAGY
jgi:hypothetical protein